MKDMSVDEIPDVKKSKNVFVNFDAGPLLLKFSMQLAKTAEDVMAGLINISDYSKEANLKQPVYE